MTTTSETLAVTGTREDPHAQSRAARETPILLHSLSLFREVFELVCLHRSISTVVEIGVESGQVSSIYTELGASRVYCVDPLPSEELRNRLAGDDRLQLVERPSPAVLRELPLADLYVIDGDHNYATVREEVGWILQNAPDAVIVLHDLSWPSARRDSYYEPSFLPDEARRPASDDGPTVWQDELTPAGFIGAGAFVWAEEAGGERNGVLTAVEDAMADSSDRSWHLAHIPAVFGVGVLLRRTPDSSALLEALRPYTGSRLLATMENNRIALYTRVLQLQHDLAASVARADQLAATVAAQRAQIEDLDARLAAPAAQPAPRGRAQADPGATLLVSRALRRVQSSLSRR